MLKSTIAVNFLLLTKLIMVTSILALFDSAIAQVDPQWLKSWREAIDMRPGNISAISKVVSEEEPGIPFVVKGQLFKPNGRVPANNVLVHMYHRDHAGFDFGPNDSSLTTWRLQGWVRTDADGKFEFHTIRPAPDHIGREGGHIHFTIVSSDFGKQWAPKIHLLDDGGFTANEKRASETAGQFAWLKEVTTIDGVQYIDVAIKLKENADF